MKKILSLILLIHTGLFAQYQLNGDATQLSCNCYELTADAGSQAGSVWNQNLINLNNPFDFKFQVFLGCDDAGADGIAFAFQPVGTGIGAVGSGMGLAGISPVLSVVVDTYQNPYDTDPNEDHIGINTNGNLAHDGGADDLAGPGLLPNVEDCQWHEFRVVWDPSTLTLSAFFDGNFITSYTGDIVNNVFGGNPEVYWGMLSATGGAWNNHQFCTELLAAFTPSDFTPCVGQDVLFTSNVNSFAPLAGYNWDFGDGSSSTEAEPSHAYAANGTYQVAFTATDQDGCEQSSTVEVVVGGGVMDVISPDAIICPGETVNLEVVLDDSEFPPCDYTLELGQNNGWFDYWHTFGTSTVDVYFDGVLHESYTQDPNNGNTQTFGFSAPYGSEITLQFNGGSWDDELSVALYDLNMDQLYSQNDLTGLSGTTLFTITSDCGFVPDYTYSWSPSNGIADASALSTNVSPDQAETYYFNLTDNGSGCQYIDSVVVDLDNNALVVDATTDIAVVCGGETIQLNANVTDNSAGGDGTFTYSWTPSTEVSNASISNPTSTPTASTWYAVTVNENGSTCFGVDSVEVTATINSSTLTASACENSPYTFEDGSIWTVLNDTVQTSILPGSGGCDSLVITTLTMLPSAQSTQSVNVCYNGSYTFEDGSIVDNIIADFVQNSYLPSASGCDSLIVTNVSVDQQLNTVQTIEVCANATYSYADGTVHNGITTNEDYTSILTSIEGCDSTVTEYLIVVSAIQVNLDVQTCLGGEFTYADGTVHTDIQSAESYTSTFSSVNGCDSLVTENLTIQTVPQGTNMVELCPGESYTYPDGTVLNSATQDEVYTSILQNAQGCDSIVITTVNVVDNGNCNIELPSVSAPNVFTPNGDGVNDVFYIATQAIQQLDLTIVNRWGNPVFILEGVDPSDNSTVIGWNGKDLKGLELTEGTYFYTYKAVSTSGVEFTGHGMLELVRD